MNLDAAATVERTVAASYRGCFPLLVRRLREFGEFLVEVGEGGFERLAMMGIGGRLQVVKDARAG
jgi:hypothetical protein